MAKAKFNMKELLNNQSKEVDSTKINVPVITAGEAIKISSERTPNIIALEINRIKEQTIEVVLKYSVEIGRRLVEAKQLLNHGEWGNWLEQSVSCSKSTANNLMRIFEEYGAEQISILGDNLKSQTFGNLTYSKALALLAIPSEDRESFIEENEIESISTRELKKLINEKKEVELKLEESNGKIQALEADTREQLNEKENEIKNLSDVVTDINNQLQDALIQGNKEEIEQLESTLSSKENELKFANRTIEALKEKLKEKPIEVMAVQDEQIIKFSIHVESIRKSFDEVFSLLDGIKDSDIKENCKTEIKVLINKIGKRIK